jgi:hypothetical protein
MKLTTYRDAGAFLQLTQASLACHEAANNLILGLCLRLKQFPGSAKTPPYLAAVTDSSGLALAAVMTLPRFLVLHSDRVEWGQSFDLLARDLLSRHWQVPGVSGPPPLALTFAQTWSGLTGAMFHEIRQLRIYELRQVNPLPPALGRLRLATLADLDLVTRWTLAFQTEALQTGTLAEAEEAAQNKIADQDLYLWENGEPVSMVSQTRFLLRGGCISSVYTPPEFRNKGYATTCVAHFSQRLLDSGWQFCALFADLANPTSNAIYQKIGYTPVADFNDYGFVTIC